MDGRRTIKIHYAYVDPRNPGKRGIAQLDTSSGDGSDAM